MPSSSREGLRPPHQGGNIPLIWARCHEQRPTMLMFSRRRPNGRSYRTQCHRRPGDKACRAIQLRTAGGQVEEKDSVTLSVGLKERRQGHRDPRIDAAVGMRITVVSGRNGACHHIPVAMA